MSSTENAFGHLSTDVFCDIISYLSIIDEFCFPLIGRWFLTFYNAVWLRTTRAKTKWNLAYDRFYSFDGHLFITIKIIITRMAKALYLHDFQGLAAKKRRRSAILKQILEDFQIGQRCTFWHLICFGFRDIDQSIHYNVGFFGSMDSEVSVVNFGFHYIKFYQRTGMLKIVRKTMNDWVHEIIGIEDFLLKYVYTKFGFCRVELNKRKR